MWSYVMFMSVYNNECCHH